MTLPPDSPSPSPSGGHKHVAPGNPPSSPASAAADDPTGSPASTASTPTEAPTGNPAGTPTGTFPPFSAESGAAAPPPSPAPPAYPGPGASTSPAYPGGPAYPGVPAATPAEPSTPVPPGPSAPFPPGGAPFQAQPPAPAAPYGAPAPFNQQNKQRNTIGIVAMVCAIIGIIFACIPGALIVGWILLPIAFILGIVALFQKEQTRWQAVTAVVVAVVGAVVAPLVFFTLVADTVDEALGEGTVSVAAPGGGAGDSDSAAGGSEGQAGSTRENPLPLGTEISNDTWRVVVNSVTFAATDAVLAENPLNEAPPEGSEYVLVNYSITYVGDDPEGATPDVSVNYVTPDGATVYSFDTLAVAPDAIDTLTTLYNGGSVTGNEVLAVPSATAQDGVLAVEPGVFGDTVFVAVK